MTVEEILAKNADNGPYVYSHAQATKSMQTFATQEKQGWVKTSERLPEIFEAVLIFTKDGYIRDANLTSGMMWNTLQPDFLSLNQVTHWMELPNKPES